MLARQLLIGAATATFLTASHGASDPTDAAGHWITKMIEATRSLDFEGSFVYFNGSGISSARLVHEISESGEEVQRLYALNGAHREVIRKGRETTLVLADGKRQRYADQFHSSLFPLAPTRDLEKLALSYTFELGTEDRVADRSCQGISILPRDEFRYGYQLWMDKETAVLMRADLVDGEGKRLEQLMFTEINIVEDANDDVALTAPIVSLTQESADEELPSSEIPGEASWYVDGGPPGFDEVMRRRKVEADDEFTDHLVLSDGLATVSVHIQPLATADEAVRGGSHMGAMSAYASVIDGFQVYVVGEVPQATVKAVALALVGPGDTR
jgi:sigma-E factor negative regulatory protein RseB